MNFNPQTYARFCRGNTVQWHIPESRLCAFMLIASLILGGCSTHLGYVPHDVYAPSFWPFQSTTGQTPKNTSPVPSYQDVKNWGFNVADGYDSRATANRQAVYFGALTAAAGVGALAGLAAFAPGSPVIVGLPIGTTFLSGAMAIYNNEQKAVIYGAASQTIRDVLIQSDCRMVKNGCTAEQSCAWEEAVALHSEVSEVMEKVNDHITLLDPQNVADRLKGVASSIEAKQATVARMLELKTEAEHKVTEDCA